MAGGEQEGRARTARFLLLILREKCDRVGEAGVPISASVMQPIFDREAEQRGMTRRFGTRWIRRRSEMGYRTCQNRRRFPTAHLDPAAPEAGHAILCRVRVSGRGGAGPHKHLNVTLFDGTEMEQEEPPEETDLILHDDDDDDAEEPESTGTAVAEAVVPIVFTPMRDRMCARIVPWLRTCQASRHPLRSWRL